MQVPPLMSSIVPSQVLADSTNLPSTNNSVISKVANDAIKKRKNYNNKENLGGEESLSNKKPKVFKKPYPIHDKKKHSLKESKNLTDQIANRLVESFLKGSVDVEEFVCDIFGKEKQEEKDFVCKRLTCEILKKIALLSEKFSKSTQFAELNKIKLSVKKIRSIANKISTLEICKHPKSPERIFQSFVPLSIKKILEKYFNEICYSILDGVLQEHDGRNAYDRFQEIDNNLIAFNKYSKQTSTIARYRESMAALDHQAFYLTKIASVHVFFKLNALLTKEATLNEGIKSDLAQFRERFDSIGLSLKFVPIKEGEKNWSAFEIKKICDAYLYAIHGMLNLKNVSDFDSLKNLSIAQLQHPGIFSTWDNEIVSDLVIA